MCEYPFFGNGGWRFRSYSESLWKSPKVTKGLLPLSFGASPGLGMPLLRSCSVGPPPSAIHGRGRLTRHPCRVAHCAEPPLGLSRGRPPPQHREAAYRPAWLFDRTHSPVGATVRRFDLLAMRPCKSTSMLNVIAPSRAGSLPQGGITGVFTADAPDG